MRGRAGAAVMVIVLLAAVGLAGCADGKGAAPPTRVSATSSTLAQTVTGAVDLRRLVVTTGPAGYDLQPSPGGRP